MRTRTFASCAALAAVALSIGASSAAAAKTEFDMRTAAGRLAPGAPLTFSSSNFQFETSGGARVSCAQATLEGTLTSNGGRTVTASFTSASLTTEPYGGCLQEPPTGFERPDVVSLAATDLPWTATLSTKGAITLAGAQGVGFELSGGGPACVWHGKRLYGTFITPYGFMETAGPNQKLRQEIPACRAHGAGNSDEATIAAEWTLTSNGEEVKPYAY